MCVYAVCHLAGVQLQEGVYCGPGSAACHGGGVLEDDLGEERHDPGHADPLQRTGTSEWP